MTSRRGVSKTVGVLIVAGLVVIAFVFSAMRPVIAPPVEEHRVRHPAGFSVVKPPEWDMTISLQSPSTPNAIIQMVPNKPEGRGGGFWAARFGAKPEIPSTGKKAMQPGTFQGKPAWVLQDLEHEKVWTRSYIFERDGAWYQVTLSRPAPEQIMGKEWSSYVESFRVEAAVGLPLGSQTAGPAPDLLYGPPAMPTTAPSAGNTSGPATSPTTMTSQP